MDILGGIKKALDVAQPIRPAARAVVKGLDQTQADPTGEKAARAAGQAAQQAAVERGKAPMMQNHNTGELKIKQF